MSDNIFNLSENSEMNPILYCLKINNFQKINYLIECGTDIGQVDDEGDNVFHIISRFSDDYTYNLDTIKYLKEKINFLIKNKEGKTGIDLYRNNSDLKDPLVLEYFKVFEYLNNE